MHGPADGTVLRSVKLTERPETDFLCPSVQGDVESKIVLTSFSPKVFAWIWQRWSWYEVVPFCCWLEDSGCIFTELGPHYAGWQEAIWHEAGQLSCWELKIGSSGFFLTKVLGWDATASCPSCHFSQLSTHCLVVTNLFLNVSQIVTLAEHTSMFQDTSSGTCL